MSYGIFVNTINEANVHVISVRDLSSGTIIRQVTVKENTVYVLEPIKETKHKHRGRFCYFLSRDGHGAYVKFLDTKRRGLIDNIADLVEYQGS